MEQQGPSYLTVKLIWPNKCTPTHQLTGLGPGRMCLQDPLVQKPRSQALTPHAG